MSEVLQYLRTSGPLRACEISRAIDMPLQDVYGYLIHAEACGMAVIHVRHHLRLWEAR